MKRKQYRRANAGAMDFSHLEEMMQKNPALGAQLLANKDLPAQIHERVRAIQIVNQAKSQHSKVSTLEQRKAERKKLKKKMKYRRRQNMGKRLRKMKSARSARAKVCGRLPMLGLEYSFCSPPSWPSSTA